MNIIGHRGAAGIALENTIASIQAAVAEDVDAVEFDVRLTKDGHFVLCHDTSFRRVGGTRQRISASAINEVRAQTLSNGEHPITLDEALSAVGTTPVFLEVKGSGWATALVKALIHKSPKQITVIARDPNGLAIFRRELPAFKLFLVQRFNPVDVLQTIRDAKRLHFDGVDLNYWLLNPLTYYLTKRARLKLVVYAVDSVWITRFLLRFFPDIDITTNYPNRLRPIRDEIRKKQATLMQTNKP